YITADGTAKAGLDYTTSNGTLTFAPGTTTQTFNVPILGDTLVEGSETFTINLSKPTNAAIGSASATATILDDDSSPAKTVVNYTVSDDWGTGFVAGITIQNNATTAINGWTLEFDLAANITSIWNAVILSHVGNHYVIGPAAWNVVIAPGATI